MELCTVVNNFNMEGNVSHIFDIGLSFNYI